MTKHIELNGKASKRSFKAATLSLHPSLIAIACHLARIAAENDYKSFSLTGEIPYTGPDQKGGPS
jgi:hypothetical protein